MILYKPKPIDIAFIILSHDGDSDKVRTTYRSIRRNYDCPVVAVMGDESHRDDVMKVEVFCRVFRGSKTITSLINAGMNNCPSPWGILAMSGAHVPKNFDSKFSIFLENENDIMFPVLDGRHGFLEATLNGLMISRTAWEKIGPMATQNSLEICKLFWALDAVETGCRFKAVVGAKIC